MLKKFHAADRNKPRHRNKVKSMLNQEFYRKLKKEHPDLMLSTQQIKSIIYTFHELCREIIANDRDGLELPEQLGFIFAGSMKARETLPAIWDSNDWICKIMYTNFASKYRFKNCKLWGFKAHRKLKHEVSVAYSKNYKKYRIIDRLRKISRIYRDNNKILREKLNEQKNGPASL